ncbi:hypothetical protein OHA72_10290 [Dactylosporangium sp. NBC_01737]|uniref:hypothetical protein n=1 Tax=Dactylosporangium sp. NBC_01737 TaxID=2975959 RepID=UPI002E10E4AD|nr:hypothetical protein OHA72_10290 [Dactylosporangium sp. NBC_01737]
MLEDEFRKVFAARAGGLPMVLAVPAVTAVARAAQSSGDQANRTASVGRVAVIISMAFVAGCGSHASSSEARPSQTSGEAVAYPFDSMSLSNDQMRTVNRGRAILVQRCLKRFGFEVSMPAQIMGNPWNGIDDRYGLTDEQHARTYGYGSKPGPQEAPFDAAVPREAIAIVYGKEFSVDNGAAVNTGRPLPSYGGQAVPSGGCAGEANTALVAGMPPGEPLNTREIEHDLTREAMTSPEVGAKIDAWRACLKKAGYEYSDPWEPTMRWSGNKATPESVTAALADVRCNQQAGLADAWRGSDVELQRKYVADHPEQVEYTKRYMQTLLQNAAKLVADG